MSERMTPTVGRIVLAFRRSMSCTRYRFWSRARAATRMSGIGASGCPTRRGRRH